MARLFASRYPHRARRIGVVGRFGSGNLGNDGSLEALLGIIRRVAPGLQLDALCAGPEVVAERFGLEAQSMSWLNRHARGRRGRGVVGLTTTGSLVLLSILVDGWRTATWTRKHDLVLIPGTGAFEGTLPDQPWQLPWILFVLSLTARLSRTKVVLVSVGASSPGTRMSGWLLGQSAAMASRRSFRDRPSREAMRALGAHTEKDPLLPDLVWSLPSGQHVEADGRPGRRGHTLVGLGVMAYAPPAVLRSGYGDPHRHVEQWAELAAGLIGDGHHVLVFGGDQGDEPVVDEVLAMVRARGHTQIERVRPRDLHELMGLIRGTELVVASRYHNVLCALMCCRPTVALGYGSKHRELMSQVGQESHALDLRDFEPTAALKHVAELLGESADVRSRLLARVGAMQPEVDRLMTYVGDSVGPRPDSRTQSRVSA